jgi:hypothetical protein
MLIGFIGLKQSGKDTAFRHLYLCEGFRRVAFADKLKDVAQDLYGLSPEQVNGHLKEAVDPRWDMTPRQILQQIGTNVAREVHPKTWIRYALGKVDTLMAAGENVAMTDVRFRNEAEEILNRGGYLVRIVRPSLRREDLHPSEREQMSIPVHEVIFNDGTLELFYSRVTDSFNTLKKVHDGAAYAIPFVPVQRGGA